MIPYSLLQQSKHRLYKKGVTLDDDDILEFLQKNIFDFEKIWI